MSKIRKKTSLYLALISVLCSCDQTLSAYSPKYNKVRSTSYTAEVAGKMKTALQKASVEYLKQGAGSLFSPLSLYDATALVSLIAGKEKGDGVARSLGFEDRDELEQSLLTYRDYFTFEASTTETQYRSRMTNALFLPQAFEFKKSIKGVGDRYGLHTLKTGDAKLLEAEQNLIEKATFGMQDARWTTDGNMALISSFAYQAGFDFTLSEEPLTFDGKEVEGLKFTTDVEYKEFSNYFVLSIPIKEEKLVFYVPASSQPLDILYSSEMLFDPLSAVKPQSSTVILPKFSASALKDDIDDLSLSREIKKINGCYAEVLPDSVINSITQSSNVEQTSTFALNEKGISASSATIINTPLAPAPTTPIVVDGPFVFSLFDAEDNPLFIGRISSL